MKKYSLIETKSLLKTLYIRIFSNRFVMVFFDIIMTTVISIHTAKIDINSEKWKTKLIIYVFITLLLNFLCVLADMLSCRSKRIDHFLFESYAVQNTLNCKTASNLYRVNKRINKVIRERKIEKGEINCIADFQNLCFLVCNELHQFITQNCDCDECEVTIYQRFTGADNKDYVKMIAYRNSKNIMPSSYNATYKLSYKNNVQVPLFVELFKDLNADIKVLEKPKRVKESFKYLEGSENRESKICQYVGVPIKTNRNKVEVVLQIDVSKKKALGKNYNAVKQFADCIIVPFANLLHCSYERDLILNKFYDILEENIDKEEI